MKSRIRFGYWETTALVLNGIFMQVFLNFPRTIAEETGTASWIQTLYITLLAAAAYSIMIKLYKKFEGKDVLDISEYAGCGFARLTFGTILLLYTAYRIATVLREYGENMKTVALPKSPISFIIFCLLTAVVFANYLGIEAISRMALFAVPIILSGYLIILIGIIPYYDISNITPLLGNGPYRIFVSGASSASVFSGIITLFVIAPFSGSYKVVRRAGYSAILFSGIILALGCFCYTLVYSYPGATQYFLPIYNMARLIYYGRFFQRVEAIFVFIWAATGMMYLSTAFFVMLYVIKKTYKLEYYKPLIFPLSILIFIISIMPASLMSTLQVEHIFLSRFTILVVFILPLIILAVAAVKKQKSRKEAK